MPVASIVALLQSALLLLTMAQSTPSLSQSFQANAVNVAQQAIAEATAALAATTTPGVQSSNQTFTTPSGAVINSQGNVISTPTPATPTLSVEISTTTAQSQSYSRLVSIAPTNSALVGSETQTVRQASIHVEWDTSIPTDSKIFLQMSGGSTKVIPSESGNSTHHIADIAGLTLDTNYNYTIEAIAGELDQKSSGTWFVFCLSSSICEVRSN